MGSLDATAPADWFLKGKGNANLVYGYTGPDPNLVRPRCSPPGEEARVLASFGSNVIHPPPSAPIAGGQGAAGAVRCE